MYIVYNINIYIYILIYIYIYIDIYMHNYNKTFNTTHPYKSVHSNHWGEHESINASMLVNTLYELIKYIGRSQYIVNIEHNQPIQVTKL